MAGWLAVAVAAGIGGTPADGMNLIVGAQSIYGPTWDRYNFTSKNVLEENADEAVQVGMNQIKVALNQKSCEGYGLTDCGGVKDLASLAATSGFRAVFSNPRLKYYMMWLTGYTTPTKFLHQDWTEAGLASLYNETRAWAEYMLTTYAGTGKVFLGGNWEGDWMLMGASDCKLPSGKFNLTCNPTEPVINRMVQWASTRQRAIDDAKAAVNAEGVSLFYYIEFNLGPAAVAGRPGIINSVLGKVNPDVVSYSSYSTTNDYQTTKNVTATDLAFHAVLSRAVAQLEKKPSTDALAKLGYGKRVIIGEYGMSLNVVGPTAEKQEKYMSCLLHAAISFGTPAVLYWEWYDNNTTIPIVPRSGTVGTLKKFLASYFTDARNFTDSYASTHAGALPPQTTFNEWAVQRFAQGCPH